MLLPPADGDIISCPRYAHILFHYIALDIMVSIKTGGLRNRLPSIKYLTAQTVPPFSFWSYIFDLP